jgi:hypothetical protein
MKPDYRVADQAGNPATLYDTDVIAWAYRQAALLRAGRFAEIDIEHVADEIEDVARSEQRELASRMAVLLAHLIKWQYQPDRRGKSWQLTIHNQRRGIERRLKRTPSLKASLRDPEWWTDAWEDAFAQALSETGRTDLPQNRPWPTAQILDPDWLPD